MSQLVTRYATALCASFDHTKATAVLDDLKALAKLTEESEEFRVFLNNPLISRESSASVLEAISAKAKFQNLTKAFLLMLARKRRLAFLPAIITEVQHLHDQASGVIAALVTSARKLTDTQLTQIKKFLKQEFKKTVKITHTINPKVLGGVRIKVGSYLIEATVQDQLRRIQSLLKEA